MKMHPIIKKSWELGQELGLNRKTMAKHIGVGDSTYYYWLDGNRNPTKKSLDKVQKFIDRVEAGETFQPKEKQKPKNIPIENIEREEARPMYELIYELEDTYGRLGNVPNDDPILILLREEAGA